MSEKKVRVAVIGVGKDLAEAIYAEPNNTYEFCLLQNTAKAVPG